MKLRHFKVFIVLLAAFANLFSSPNLILAEETPADEPTEQVESADTAEDSETHEENTNTDDTSESDEESSSEENSLVEDQVQTVNLHVRFQSYLIYEGEITLPTQDVLITDANGLETYVSSTSVLALLYSLDADNTDFNISELTYYESFGSFFLNCIEVTSLNHEACGKWIFTVNDAYPFVGMDAYALKEADEVYIFYGSQYRAYADNDSFEPNTDITGYAQTYDYTSDTWNAVTNVTLSVLQENPENPWAPHVITSSPVGEDGSVQFSISSTGTYMLGIEEDFYINTHSFEITEQSAASTELIIRYGDAIIHHDSHILSEGSISIIDSNEISVAVDADSALGILYAADQANDSFEISELTYYEAFDSFLLNCIDAEVLETPACGNWHYAVDQTLPYIGMNAYTVSDGQRIYVYFGNTREVTVSSSPYIANTEFTLESKSYQYETNTWEPLSDVTIAITQTNPDNPWEPIIITTSSVNVSGEASFTLSATGTYYASLVEDFYFPSFEFQVSEAIAPQENTDDNSGDSEDNGSTCSSCSSGTGETTVTTISSAEINTAINKLLGFIKSKQLDSGAIQDGPTSEWLAMSFASKNIYSNTITNGGQTLYDFVKAYDYSAPSDLNTCAAYPRHILALLSSGVGKGSELITSTAQKIKSECVSDSSYGAGGINDDIFALLALLAIDTPISNNTVTTILNAIKNDQTNEGAFTWSGFAAPDATGAAINALKYAQQKGIQVHSDVFTDAKAYLKQEQLSDGGWGYENSDVLTTSWVMMGLNALNEGQSKWTTASGKNPWHVLVENIEEDGSYESAFAPGEPDWFAIKHAIPALSGKSWPIVLTPKASVDDTTPIININNGCSSCETDTGATSTRDAATSTPQTKILSPTTTPTSSPVVDIDTTIQTEPSSTEPIAESVVTDNTAPSDAEQVSQVQTPVSNSLQNPTEAQNTQNYQNEAPEIQVAESVTEETTIEDTEIQQEDPEAPLIEQNQDTFASSAARRVFNSALAGSAGMGLLLAWRFGRTLL